MCICGYEVVSNESAPGIIGPNTGANVDVPAPAGKKVLGGGYLLGPGGLRDYHLVSGSYPTDDNETWRVTAFNKHTSIDMEVAVWAICAPVCTCDE